MIVVGVVFVGVAVADLDRSFSLSRSLFRLQIGFDTVTSIPRAEENLAGLARYSTRLSREEEEDKTDKWSLDLKLSGSPTRQVGRIVRKKTRLPCGLN